MGDVFAVEEVVAVDVLYLLIYFLARGGDVFACCNAHHHASAIGLQYTIVVLRSHVEDWTIKLLCAFNHRTFRITARITL